MSLAFSYVVSCKVRHVPGYWPPKNVCDFMLQNKPQIVKLQWMQCSKKNIDYYFSVVETVEEFGEPVEKDSRAPRGNRPVFECYWNGRLIPYTYTGV